jgi:pimeloyl-ACP methyl ester carboxylesterase
MQDVFAYVDAHRDQSLEELFTLLRQPSISTQNVGVVETAQMLAGMMRDAGIETTIYETTGFPVIYGELRAPTPAPTLLIWGDNDPVIPPSSADLLRREIPDCRLLLMRGTSHVPMFERPREFNDALLRFLGGEQLGE